MNDEEESREAIAAFKVISIDDQFSLEWIGESDLVWRFVFQYRDEMTRAPWKHDSGYGRAWQ